MSRSDRVSNNCPYCYVKYGAPHDEHCPLSAGHALCADKDVRVGGKYVRTIKGVQIDVYEILCAWPSHNPAIDHAIKKLLMPGSRGHKDRLQDIQEAIESLNRALELEVREHV